MLYVKGDATNMQGSGNKILAHIVNNRGGWGKGFVLAISKRWKQPEEAYRDWYKNRSSDNFILGQVQYVEVEKYILVANMLCQDGYKGGSNPVPVKYNALEKCIKQLAITAKELKASIHMPRIGCGLGGASWDKIESILIDKLVSQNISVTVYDFMQ